MQRETPLISQQVQPDEQVVLPHPPPPSSPDQQRPPLHVNPRQQSQWEEQ